MQFTSSAQVSSQPYLIVSSAVNPNIVQTLVTDSLSTLKLFHPIDKFRAKDRGVATIVKLLIEFTL